MVQQDQQGVGPKRPGEVPRPVDPIPDGPPSEAPQPTDPVVPPAPDLPGNEPPSENPPPDPFNEK